MDVSALVALLWENHEQHSTAKSWCAGKSLVLCPITELGFVRVSSSPAHNATVEEAREILADFIKARTPGFIAADLRILDANAAPSSGKSTDWYLGDLATAHKMKWATLDKKAAHPAAVVIE
jgi:predicted nucleic acid-binding protein